MSDVYTDYGLLLKRFLNGAISIEAFQRAYLGRFKNERRKLDEDVFDLLDELFGDVDAFTTAPELLSENPGFYLDETALRKKVTQAAKRLAELQRVKWGTPLHRQRTSTTTPDGGVTTYV